MISRLLSFQANEVEFLTRLNDHGEITPQSLTGEEKMQAIIQSHPALLWKAGNVRRYFVGRGKTKGVSPDPGDVKES